MNERQLEAGPHTDEIHQKEGVGKKERKTGQQDPWTKQEDLQLICLSRDCRDSGRFRRGRSHSKTRNTKMRKKGSQAELI